MRIMEIYNSNKIELEYDFNDRMSTFTFNDLSGHYIDSIKLDNDDFNDFYKALVKYKNGE